MTPPPPTSTLFPYTTLFRSKSNLDLNDKGASLGNAIEDEFDNPIYNQRNRGYAIRSEEHTSELQSRPHLVCRLLLEKKKHSRCRVADHRLRSAGLRCGGSSR